MTGFGRHREIENEREIFAEVKSVNGRYLDVYVKVPKIYGFLEDKIRREVSKFISRGKIEVYLSIENIAGENVKITLNKTYLDSYMEILRSIRDTYDLPDDISTMRVAQNRDIYSVEKLEDDEEQLWISAARVLTRALCEFDEMRAHEGAKLLEDMSARVKKCGEVSDEIEILSDKCQENYYDSFKKRLSEMTAEMITDENRIITEAAIYADKISVNEELVRLKSHFSQFYKIAGENAPVGRKLDFLLQEINREINTIGSKSLDLNITNKVIELKSDVEKIREQIQNIE